MDDAKKDVLVALSQIIDPDFGTDIVSCGFVKDLEINEALDEVTKGNSFAKLGLWCAMRSISMGIGDLRQLVLAMFQVSFRLELTTPACPIKDEARIAAVSSIYFSEQLLTNSLF